MFRPAWFLVATLVVPEAVSFSQEEVPSVVEPRPAIRPVGEALGEPVDVTVSPSERLSDVFNNLGAKHGFAVELLGPGIEERTFRNLRSDVTLRGVELGFAMSILLNRTDLAWQDRDGTLAIAPREAVAASAAERIRAALDQETRLEFPNTPLREALNFLSDVHRVGMVIDEPKLSEAGVNIDENVDVVLKGITLGAGLNLLLEPYGATYVVSNDVLLVTTNKRAAREVDTRSYDVSALVGENGYATEAAEVVTELLEPRSTLANAMITVEGGASVPLPQPRIVPYKRQLLVTASWADQRRVEEILRLMGESRR